MADPHLVTLCRDYLDLIREMASGRYSTADLHTLDSDRQLLHNELLRITGLDPADDMAAYARRVLHAARAGGQYG